VRCRQTFQREILRSRHYVTKFLARRGFIFREGAHWTRKHRRWLEKLLRGGLLAAEDRWVFGEYLALMDYKLSRRDDLDEQIEKIAFSEAYRPLVCRHVLVQAAWKYRHRPAVGVDLKKRQGGQPPQVIAHAWKAQHRLYKLYHRIAFKKKNQIAAVAAAREFVGFIWAVMRDLEIHQATSLTAAA